MPRSSYYAVRHARRAAKPRVSNATRPWSPPSAASSRPAWAGSAADRCGHSWTRRASPVHLARSSGSWPNRYCRPSASGSQAHHPPESSRAHRASPEPLSRPGRKPALHQHGAGGQAGGQHHPSADLAGLALSGGRPEPRHPRGGGLGATLHPPDRAGDGRPDHGQTAWVSLPGRDLPQRQGESVHLNELPAGVRPSPSDPVDKGGAGLLGQ